MENDDKKDLHTFASFVHGSLFSLHALGAVYNFKRKNVKTALFHTGAALFDLWCAREHVNVINNNVNEERKK